MSFIEDYMEYAMEFNSASPDYHHFMALAVVSNALSNRVFLPWGDGRIYPHMWLIFVGESFFAHKSSAVNIGKNLLNIWKSGKVYPDEFSYERLLTILSKNPCGTFFIDEFKNFSNHINREYMKGTKSLLCELYYGRKRVKELASETYVIDRPAFGICACCATDWFSESLKDTDLTQGWLSRWLVVPSVAKGKDKPILPPADREKLKALLSELDIFRSVGGPIYWDNDAKEVHNEWYRRNKANAKGGRLDSFVGRLQEYVIKLSSSYTIIYTHSSKVTGSLMETAVEKIEWLWDQLVIMEKEELTVTKDEVDQRAIRRYLKANSGKAKRSDIMRNCHLDKLQMNKAIESLIEYEEIRIGKERAEGSKKYTQWIYSI